MAQHYLTNGEIHEIHPADGTAFTLAEMQAAVGGFIEVVQINSGGWLIVNEEGRIHGHPLNVAASLLAERDTDLGPGGPNWFSLFGNVLLMSDDEWNRANREDGEDEA